jgi:hypothetical protein
MSERCRRLALHHAALSDFLKFRFRIYADGRRRVDTNLMLDRLTDNLDIRGKRHEARPRQQQNNKSARLVRRDRE